MDCTWHTERISAEGDGQDPREPEEMSSTWSVWATPPETDTNLVDLSFAHIDFKSIAERDLLDLLVELGTFNSLDALHFGLNRRNPAPHHLILLYGVTGLPPWDSQEMVEAAAQLVNEQVNPDREPTIGAFERAALSPQSRRHIPRNAVVEFFMLS